VWCSGVDGRDERCAEEKKIRSVGSGSVLKGSDGEGPGQVGALETVQRHGVGLQQPDRGVREQCRCRATASGGGVMVETRWGARSSVARCGTK
jgi:hypothetical protein